MKKFIAIFLTAALFIPITTWADELAPVVSGTPNIMQADNNTTSTLSLPQRVAQLERQVNAMNQINLMSQINTLQQQVQELQGQVELLTHNMQNTQNQIVTQYADVNQRLQRLGSKSTVPPTATSTPTSSLPPVPATINPNATAALASTAATISNAPAINPVISNTSNKTGTLDEQSAYQAAYDKIQAKQYNDATTAMQNFLVQYPNGHYAPNAYYWLGQLSLLQGNGQAAEKYFNSLIASYPSDPKVRDANLKLGFAYILENKMGRAKEQFKEVVRQYPGTETAQLAQARLAQMP